ncbi:MAG: hypothetical protein AAFX04_08605 [Pseudomonadota bacterium]
MRQRSGNAARFPTERVDSRDRGHPFRAGLPLSALIVEPDPEAAVASSRAEDARLFFLSFATFFLAISAFIW